VSTRVVLATRNAHKVAELRRILMPYVDGVELLGLDELPDIAEVAETGATFADNALLKARAVAEQTGLVAVADDSGLAVDALNGMPGVLSARWSGMHGDDDGNLRLVLAQLRDVLDDRRGAAFVCAAAAVAPDGREVVATGRLEGVLTHAARGSGGFGYDPIFQPVGEQRTTAELSAGDKDAISHRGLAFRALGPLLRELLLLPPARHAQQDSREQSDAGEQLGHDNAPVRDRANPTN
jgi:XTP/dITP diphosphohydrolase